MSISGLLSTMNLPEVLQWIQLGQKTGTAIFERRGIVKKVFVENGLIVSASSNDPKEYLGQILLCFGSVTEGVLEEAFKKQALTNRLLGRILQEDYHLTKAQILQALRIKIEETVFDLFLWDEGKFIYSNGINQLQNQERLDAAISIDHVLFEGARRQDEWKEFTKEFSSDDVIFQKKNELDDQTASNFITNKIFQFIDGSRSMRRVLLESHSPEYRGHEAFAKLYWGGFIEYLKRDLPKKVESSTKEQSSTLQLAVEFFKQKDWDRAYSLAEEFLSKNPDHEEGKMLVKVIHDAYVKELYEKCPPESIPELTIDLADLSERVYSSREGFLASRINGQWNVKSLVMISPLGEFDSMRILKRLVDEGVVKLRRKEQGR